MCSAGGGCLWFGAHLRDEQIERRTQELIRQGNAPEEARREAERETSSESHDFDWD